MRLRSSTDRHRRRRAAWMAVLLTTVAQPPAWADTAAALQSRGYHAAYSLDREEARALFQQAVALAPESAAAHRGLATISWLTIASSRGIVTSDEFLGGAPRQTLELPPPPAEPARLFHEHAAKAMQLAEARVRANARDPDAQYDLGATVGLQASYMASIEGKLFAAFRSARRAYSAHERVLELDPARKDAGLIVGTYRYLVSTFSLPGRWVAYMVGFGGGRERGLRMIEEAAAHAGDAQTEALFALVILYNREQRYPDALKVLADLRRRYPRNRLLWLEAGSTALRAGRHAEAEQFLVDGMQRLGRDDRPRIFGEEALWRYKLGEVKLARGQRAAAREALQASLPHPARDWVRARTHLALGKLADHDRDRESARRHYQFAMKFGHSGRDSATLDEARRLSRRR
jgi:tetratricopeptide (TPR) repeat protein